MLNGFNDDVNIIVFFDYGMMNLMQIVNIIDVLNMLDIKVIFQELFYVIIWLEEGQFEKVGIYMQINKIVLFILKICLFLDLSNEIFKFSIFVYVNLIVFVILIYLFVFLKDFFWLFWDVFYFRI